MSDQDRGPYTPQRETPLQFDARRPRTAQPMPTALIGSGVVLLVLIGGVVAAYTGVFGHKDPQPRTVGDRVIVMKTAPPPGQQVAPDPAAKLEVFSDKAAPAAPNFAPDAEKPAPRPTLQVRPSTPPSLRITPVAAPAPNPALAPAPAPAKAGPRVGAATDLSTAHTAPAVAPPAVAAPASAAPKTSAAAATVVGSAGAQIGAFSSRELAEKGFADVGKIASTAGRGKRIEAVEHGGATLYRTTVTGFADRDAAKEFCASLAAKGHACIVKG